MRELQEKQRVEVVVSSAGHICTQEQWDRYLADSIPPFPFWVEIKDCAHHECHHEEV